MIKLRRPSHATIVAYLALVVAMSGTAAAATGGNFILGQKNTAGRASTLTSTTSSPLALNAPTGKPPLWVNSTVRVARLNASLLDGHPAGTFLTKAGLSGGIVLVPDLGLATCPAGTADETWLYGTITSSDGYTDFLVCQIN